MKKGNVVKIALLPITLLVIAAAILFIERVGLQANVAGATAEYLPSEIVAAAPDKSGLKKECLIITDDSDEYAIIFEDRIKEIFDNLCVGYDRVTVESFNAVLLKNYSTAVVIVPDYASLGSNIYVTFDWINNGGRLLNLFPLEPTPVTKTVVRYFGAREVSDNFTQIAGVKFVTDFMIGSKGFTYMFDEDTVGVMSMRLGADTTTHAVSDTGIPLLWETEYGAGRIVVNNLALSGRDAAGFIAAAYSLLEDAFAYPVINTSAFYIDDFPSPLPSGRNDYIDQFYDCDIKTFFTDIWWPDMIDFAKIYGIKYTGLLIEDYTDKTEPPYTRNVDTGQFKSFGNMLLNLGGEIGYHGYSHQPLCYTGFDFMGKVEYNTWNSVADSLLAFKELESLGNDLFSENRFETYVPPSNILSDEGREMIISNFPGIKVISGIYQKEDYEYQQDFDISDDGIINVPRITSGTTVEGYEHWIALNELNYQYVNTHFFHPDDVLDPARGAELGWEKMFNNLNDYIRWIYDSAPNLRRQTSADAGKAVQRYATISVSRTVTDDRLIIDIDNFYDSAYLIVRINEGRPSAVSGGTMEELGTGLYVLSATESRVEIEIVR